MSLRDELLIPFRGIGEVGHNLMAGSAVLWGRGKGQMRQALRRLPRPDKAAPLGDKLEAAVVAVFVIIGATTLAIGGGKLLLHLMKPYLGWIAMAGVAAWFLAALLAAPAAQPAKNGENTKEFAVSPDLSAEVLARFVQAIAARHGQRGVHLDDLLPHLPGVDRQRLLAALRGAGIPIEKQLKLIMPNGMQRNRQGVRVQDIPAHLLETEPAP